MPTLAAESINPASGQHIASYPFHAGAEIDGLLAIAHRGFSEWCTTEWSERAATFYRLAAVLRSRTESLAQMATLEMGKPIAQARAEVEKCAVLCEWYAKHGSAIIGDEATSVGDAAHISYLPLGPVLAVMPWNIPYWQVMRGAVPILTGGNTFVLKPAPNVIGCARLIASAWEEAGLIAGAFVIINASRKAVSDIIADRRIRAVVVTGSVRAGSAIAARSGAALKRSVLELGGSDPFIVLADADIDQAAHAAVISRFQNVGQTCIAAKRIILEQSIARRFTDRFAEEVAALKVGPPLDESNDLGPMAVYRLRDELDLQVQKSIDAGAQVLLQGGKVSGAGNYYAPTILTEVTSNMMVFRQETFGPVASLSVAADVEQALSLANDSEFGLSCALWSADLARARRLARRIEAGGVFINGTSASDPRVPIGGVKSSGYGRELSYFGVREFMNAQTVWAGRC
jgi:succinate-semialdehyde dehydrogenase